MSDTSKPDIQSVRDELQPIATYSVLRFFNYALLLTTVFTVITNSLKGTDAYDPQRSLGALVTSLIAVVSLFAMRRKRMDIALYAIYIGIFVALVNWQWIVQVGIRGLVNGLLVVMIPVAALAGGIKHARVSLAGALIYLCAVTALEYNGYLRGMTGVNITSIYTALIFYIAMCLMSYGITISYTRSIDRALAAVLDREEKRHSAEIQLTREMTESRSLIEGKDKFIALLSHELRTPLSGIMTGAQILNHPKASDEIKNRSASSVKLAASGLLELLNNLLDSHKLMSGNMSIAQDVFSLRDLMAETQGIFEMTAQSKQLQMFQTVGDEVASNYVGDPVRLKQMLANLVGNALKFTDAGFVRMHVAVLSSSPAADSASRPLHTLKFVVQDTGKGISSDGLQKLFKEYSQLQAEAKSGVGSGLGLSLVRNFSELMGGTAGADSTEGQGSIFWFSATLEVANSINEQTASA